MSVPKRSHCRSYLERGEPPIDPTLDDAAVQVRAPAEWVQVLRLFGTEDAWCVDSCVARAPPPATAAGLLGNGPSPFPLSQISCGDSRQACPERSRRGCPS